jgi:hypothetical protein
MFPNGTKRAPEIDKSWAVQVQGRHGRSAGGGPPLDVQEVRVPGEMTRPALAARVE